MRFVRLALVCLATGALAAACANGGDVSSTFSDETGGAGGDMSGSSGSMHSSSHSSASHAAASSSNAASSTGSAMTSSSSGMGCDYSAPDTCDTAEELSSIDGDQNSDTRIVKGTTSKWYKVKVNEAVSSVISYPQLSFTATLESPPGMQFDLYVYNGDIGAPNCFNNPILGVGTPESVSEYWGDSIGSDDTLWFSYEVRYVSGMICDPNSQWTLTIEGHTIP